MRIKNESMISGSVSLAANTSTLPIWLGHVAIYSIQLVYTGTPDGSFKLQASNDPGDINAAERDNQDVNIVNWTDVASSTVAVSAAGNTLYNVENAGYNWVRVVWTADTAGSTPVLTVARAMTKGV